MPVEVGIWKLGSGAESTRLQLSSLRTEAQLEQILEGDISILDPRLWVIGRQVETAYGKFIDLLAIDADGTLIVIELKRDRTPREVVAQLLDYGSWVRNLDYDAIVQIFDKYMKKYRPGQPEVGLEQAFCQRFGLDEIPESINENHELLVVASELDDSTERIVNYLAEQYAVAINAVFFRCFVDGDHEYLSRVWLRDPIEAEVKAVETRGDEPWNGEYYVSFGNGDTRRWEDARTHGYIAAGGGAWYSNTLRLLVPGVRIWANVPGRGYVGVGRVTSPATPITEFKLPDKHGLMQPIKIVVESTPKLDVPSDELEYYVGIEWIKTVPLEEAIKEKGFFGNQNSVARPKATKWKLTVERLKKRFGLSDNEATQPT